MSTVVDNTFLPYTRPYMANTADNAVWELERAFMNEERKKFPELFVVPEEAKKTLLQRVGIRSGIVDRPQGYIRYSPLDFLVEEVGTDGQPITIGVENSASQVEGAADRQADEQGTVYADLVKIGLSTIDAVNRLAEALGLGIEKVRYAGIKDAVAVTAQKISIRGVSLATVQALDLPNIHLKNIYEGKGAINVGDLQGNRFTLFVRTPGRLDDERLRLVLEFIREHGVVNFYGPQRFGSPRFLSHLFGMYLCRGNSRGCVMSYLTETSPTEAPYITNVRKQAASLYGKWLEMRQVMEKLPHTFRHELVLLRSLEGKSGSDEDCTVALKEIPQQVDLWARAYASFLTNQLLSYAVESDQLMPTEIPLLLAMDPAVKELYAPFLKANNTGDYVQHLRKFNFIHLGKSPKIPTIIRPVLHTARNVEPGVAVSFDLPKAAYATTVLAAMFDVTTGYPIPEWLDGTDVDSKELVEMGSLAEIKKKFAKEIAAAMEGKSGEGAEAAE